MIITDLLLKTAFNAILEECNRIAYTELVREEIRRLQSELIQLRVQYDANMIDASTYSEKEREILQIIRRIASPANR